MNVTELARHRRLQREGIGLSATAVSVRRARTAQFRREQLSRGDDIPGGITMGVWSKNDTNSYLQSLAPEAREKVERMMQEKKINL